MTALYENLGVPFGFLLRLIYDTVGFQNYAISIVLLTLVTRLITIPSTISQQKSMAKTQRIQSKIRRIQTKYAGNQQKIQEETSALYQREGFGAANILQEILTVKSDDVTGRAKTYEAIVKGDNLPKPGIPEAMNVLLHELRGLALSVKLE